MLRRTTSYWLIMSCKVVTIGWASKTLIQSLFNFHIYVYTCTYPMLPINDWIITRHYHFLCECDLTIINISSICREYLENLSYISVLYHGLYNNVEIRGSRGVVCQGHVYALQWRHDERDSVSNHQPHDCLFHCLCRRRSKKTSKLRVTGLCARNSPVTGDFPAQRPVTR